MLNKLVVEPRHQGGVLAYLTRGCGHVDCLYFDKETDINISYRHETKCQKCKELAMSVLNPVEFKKSEYGVIANITRPCGHVDALFFSSEEYCTTSSRQEQLCNSCKNDFYITMNRDKEKHEHNLS